MLLALPDEILIQTLCNLPPASLFSCQLTCFKLNSIIALSTLIQYQLALSLAGYEDIDVRPLPLSSSTRRSTTSAENTTTRAALNYSHVSPAEKLERLKVSRKAWQKVKPRAVRRVDVVDRPTCGIYDLTGGTYLLGSHRRLDVHCLILPDGEQEEEVVWKTIGVDEVLIDIGVCVDEHDLIVIVTTTQISTDPAVYDIGLHFIQFSTGRPHPLARHPRISAHKSRFAKPPVGIQIVGQNLVLILAHPFHLDPNPPQTDPHTTNAAHSTNNEDKVYVFDWRTGSLNMTIIAPPRSYSGLIFLTEHLILLPNTQRGVLEIWDLPRSHSAPSPAAPLCILELPLLAPGRSFGPLSCRAEPNPMGELKSGTMNSKAGDEADAYDEGGGEEEQDLLCKRRMRRAWKAKAEEAIVVFNVRIQPVQTGLHPVPAVGFSHIYTFFVHRKSILRVVEEDREGKRGMKGKRKGGKEETKEVGTGGGAGTGRDSPIFPPKDIDIDFPSSTALFPEPVPWETWGPRTTRWLEADDVPTRWITTTAGQRAVLISSHARSTQGSGSPIVVMDFTPWNVTRLVRRHEEKRRRRGRVEERRRIRRERVVRRRFEGCKAWLEREERRLGGEVCVDLGGVWREPVVGADPEAAGVPLVWPELEEGNGAAVKIFLEKFYHLAKKLQDGGEPGALGEEPTHSMDDSAVIQDSDSEIEEVSSDSDTDTDSPGTPRPGPGGGGPPVHHTKRPNWWCLKSAQPVDRAGVCFASPVVSELPCLGYTSKGRFHYDGVLMDEERILGITTNRADRIKTVEVQYFG